MLSLFFNGVAYTGVATCASGGIASLYCSLHTSSAGIPTGNQGSAEAAYGGYSRVAVTRSTAGWTVTTNSVSPVANISFPAGASGGETVTYFGVGTSAVGTGHLWYMGSVSPSIATGNGITPVLTQATAISET